MEFKFHQFMNKKVFFILITSIFIFSFTFAGQPQPGCPSQPDYDSDDNYIDDRLEQNLLIKFRPIYLFSKTDVVDKLLILVLLMERESVFLIVVNRKTKRSFA